LSGGTGMEYIKETIGPTKRSFRPVSGPRAWKRKAQPGKGPEKSCYASNDKGQLSF